jgi:hypothetical protein
MAPFLLPWLSLLHLPEGSMSQTTAAGSLKGLAHIIRAEYREMPEMRLTVAQFCKLWHLDQDACEEMIAHLVLEGFLAKDRAGRLLLHGTGPT